MSTDRIFGEHEAAAMFESIANALGMLGTAGQVSGMFLRELREERELMREDIRNLQIERDHLERPVSVVRT